MLGELKIDNSKNHIFNSDVEEDSHSLNGLSNGNTLKNGLPPIFMANKKGAKKKPGVTGLVGGGVFNATTKKNFPILKKVSDSQVQGPKKSSYVSPYSIKAIQKN
mmetsp:Transcript_36670/g.35453  ORF Transcript_36670/g.35453 Transcript_36670/m.35453 type:complete len:105 (+) Transcript_36670:1113-1427(+)